jgi:ABC-type molybdate transport system ATPase subunit
MTSVRLSWKQPPDLSLEVDFPLGAGITAICGPAGAGKSFILEAIAGFAQPDAGRILLNDVILYDGNARVSLPPRIRGCGYVPQAESLWPHLTLDQNLGVAAWRFARLERLRRVSEMRERFGLRDGRWWQLTPAERLRAEVARALLAEPKLLLIDDRGADEALLRTIREVTQAPILLVTGDLDLCAAAVNDLILLDLGRIAQRGGASAILERPESVEAARLLGIANVLQATIASLDPGRNTSRLEFESFSLPGPYIPGHFRGDRVWVALRSEDLRIHPADRETPPNAVPLQLVRATQGVRTVRLEFAGPIFAEVPRAEFARGGDNKDWSVEFPPESLKVL